jgi:hypothetical protein
MISLYFTIFLLVIIDSHIFLLLLFVHRNATGLLSSYEILQLVLLNVTDLLFETATLFVTILVVAFLLQEGR